MAASIESLDFDCFKVCEFIGRNHTFTAITYKLIMDINSVVP